MGRYQVGGSEGETEPGSGGLVLANKLGITSAEAMEEAELVLLEKLYNAVLGAGFAERALTVADLKEWHYQWLGNVYEWAGEERNVNLSKGGFHFAAAAQIPRLLDEFDRKVLARKTPCHGITRAALIETIAVTHVELILIHPFREGNGRLARLLADVMAVQADHGLLDYSSWDEDRSRYFAAIQHGHAGAYEPMLELVDEALGR